MREFFYPSSVAVFGVGVQPGNLAKVCAVFTNTGQIEVWAEFNGEVYLGGELIEVIKSEKLLVKRDSTENLAAYFTPQQTGEYSVKGYVLFEGKKTNVLETKVTIGNELDETDDNPFNMIIPIAGGIIVLPVVIGFLLLRKRKVSAR